MLQNGQAVQAAEFGDALVKAVDFFERGGADDWGERPPKDKAAQNNTTQPGCRLPLRAAMRLSSMFSNTPYIGRKNSRQIITLKL